MNAFDPVAAAGLTLAGVEAATRYDGSPVLKVNGRFMAGLAVHASAEPATLIVRIDPADRETLISEAPDTYYVTEHYRRHAVVLARLARLERHALLDLLRASRRLTLAGHQANGPEQRRPS